MDNVLKFHIKKFQSEDSSSSSQYAALLFFSQNWSRFVSILETVEAKSILRRVVVFVDLDQEYRVQYEAIFILNGCAYLDGLADVLIETDFATRLLEIIAADRRRSSVKVQKLAIRCIGNVAEKESGRKHFLESEALKTCARLFYKRQDIPKSIIVRTMANLCRDYGSSGRPPTDFAMPLSIFSQVLEFDDTTDVKTIFETCRGLNYLTDRGNDEFESMAGRVLKIGAAVKLINVVTKTKTLGEEDQKILMEAIAVFTNLMLGRNEHMQILLDAGVLPTLRDVLAHANVEVAAQTCWTLANVAASATESQRRTMLECPGLMPVVIAECVHSSILVRTQAGVIISNLLIYGGDEIRHALIDLYCLEALCHVLKGPDVDFYVLKTIVDAFAAVLKLQPYGVEKNSFAQQITVYGGEDRLRQLSQIFSWPVSEEESQNFGVRCNEILLKYF